MFFMSTIGLREIIVNIFFSSSKCVCRLMDMLSRDTNIHIQLYICLYLEAHICRYIGVFISACIYIYIYIYIVNTNLVKDHRIFFFYDLMVFSPVFLLVSLYWGPVDREIAIGSAPKHFPSY